MKAIIKRVLTKALKRLLRNDTVAKAVNKNGSYSNSLVDTLVPEFVEIGANFISAPGSIILGHDASLLLFTKKYRIQKTIIGNNVFLGANSVVLPGVIIGDNVIVGAGSVVTKNIASNSVVAGNPARVMCSVVDYCKKCEEKGLLYEPGESLLNAFEAGDRFSADVVLELRKTVDEQYKARYGE